MAQQDEWITENPLPDGWVSENAAPKSKAAANKTPMTKAQKLAKSRAKSIYEVAKERWDEAEPFGFSPETRQALGMNRDDLLGVINRYAMAAPNAALAAYEGLNAAIGAGIAGGAQALHKIGLIDDPYKQAAALEEFLMVASVADPMPVGRSVVNKATKTLKETPPPYRPEPIKDVVVEPVRTRKVEAPVAKETPKPVPPNSKPPVRPLPEVVNENTPVDIAPPKTVSPVVEKPYYTPRKVESFEKVPPEIADVPEELPIEQGKSILPEIKGENAPQSVVDKVTESLNKLDKLVEEQKALYKTERSAKVKEASNIDPAIQGRERYLETLKRLKGDMTKVKFEDLKEAFSQEDIDGLFNSIDNNPSLSFYDKLNTKRGLERLLDGELPRPSELERLKKAFSSEMVNKLIKYKDDIKTLFSGEGGQAEMFKNIETLSTGPIRKLKPEEKPFDPDKFIDDPKQGDLFKEKPSAVPKDKKVTKTKKPPKEPNKFYDTTANLLNLPRSFMSTADFSAMFRQAIFLVGRKEFWKNWNTQFKGYRSEVAFKEIMQEIKNRPTYSLMEEAGLAVSEIGTNLHKREEAFMSTWAEKAPVVGRAVRAHERAYVAFLDKVRADTFDSLVKLSEKAGIDLTTDKKALNDIAKFINSATGRGNLGSLNKSAPLLNTVFFSPRLMKSRIDLLNPYYYYRLSPVVRKEALKSLLAFGGIATTIATLAKLGGADVESDPRSSDFAKIKVGNTRYDILGGFGQYITLGARLVTNETKPLKGGKVKELGEKYGDATRKDILEKFIENKFAPIPGYFRDALQGSNPVGEPFNAQEDAIKLFIPLVLQDLQDLVNEEGWIKGGIMSVPSIFGVSTSTFDANAPRKGKEEPEDDEWITENTDDTESEWVTEN